MVSRKKQQKLLFTFTKQKQKTGRNTCMGL